jgi:hypothetical protein
MSPRCVLPLLLLGFSLGCPRSSGVPTACLTDTDCTTGEYCLTTFAGCGDGTAIATGGQCFRDCSNNACSCTSGNECPLGTCDLGVCHELAFKCPASPACNMPGCGPDTSVRSMCPTCVCQACADAGIDAGEDGGVDAGGEDAGTCGTGSCLSDQLCCTYFSGIADGGSYDACDALGPDGGCPSGAVCTLARGALTSCNVYLP